MSKIVKHGYTSKFFLGMVYPDQRESIIFNIKDSSKKAIEGDFPTYDSDDFKGALKARSKAMIALDMEKLMETTFNTEDFIFLCWSTPRDEPLVVPAEVEKLFTSVEIPSLDQELSIPMVIKAADCAVERQPVNIWLKYPKTIVEDDLDLLKKALTSWILLSRRWWLETSSNNPMIKEKTINSIR